MRIFFVAVLALAAVPLELDAQEIPYPTREPRPVVPAELPPIAPPLTQQLTYRRSHFSVESYPLVTVMHAPVLPRESGQAVWAQAGAGVHVGYRVSRFALATFDVTSSAWGGPSRAETAEAGARFMADRYESRTRPFADVRLGYISASSRAFVREDGDGGTSSPVLMAFGGRGFGGVIGAGLHQDLTRSISVSAAASLMRGSFLDDGLSGASRDAGITALRLSLGLRFNPVRQIVTAQTPTRHPAPRSSRPRSSRPRSSAP